MSCTAAKSALCSIPPLATPGSRSSGECGRFMIERDVYTPEAENDVTESWPAYFML